MTWPPPEELAEGCLASIQGFATVVQSFGSISGGTEVATRFIDEARACLKDYGKNLNSSPVAEIDRKLEYWRGPYGSASWYFRREYLNSLKNGLHDQYVILLWLSSVVKSYEAVIDQARQNYLDILSAAIKNWKAVLVKVPL